jgi:hypothetical protein
VKEVVQFSFERGSDPTAVGGCVRAATSSFYRLGEEGSGQSSRSFGSPPDTGSFGHGSTHAAHPLHGIVPELRSNSSFDQTSVAVTFPRVSK